MKTRTALATVVLAFSFPSLVFSQDANAELKKIIALQVAEIGFLKKELEKNRIDMSNMWKRLDQEEGRNLLLFTQLNVPGRENAPVKDTTVFCITCIKK